MGSFTTVNKVDADGFICKYENFATKEEADARIVELHKIAGYEDAFVVDNAATAVNGEVCFQKPKHFPVNKENKTVSFDQSAFDADKNAKNMKWLRVERKERLEATDKSVLPDRWVAMDDDAKAAWSTYRQKLRDLPANPDTIAWANSDSTDLDDIAWPPSPDN